MASLWQNRCLGLCVWCTPNWQKGELIFSCSVPVRQDEGHTERGDRQISDIGLAVLGCEMAVIGSRNNLPELFSLLSLQLHLFLFLSPFSLDSVSCWDRCRAEQQGFPRSEGSYRQTLSVDHTRLLKALLILFIYLCLGNTAVQLQQCLPIPIT